MTGRYVLGVVVAFLVLTLILSLVGRRRMREEYSVLWIIAGVMMLVFALLGRHTEGLVGLVGIESVPNALFFFGLIFLVIVNIYSSVKISALTNRMKELVQYIALLEAGRQSPNGREPARTAEPPVTTASRRDN